LPACSPASWPNRLFRRTCSGPIDKSPSSFRRDSPRHRRLAGISRRRLSVRATTTAVAARLVARVSAVPPVTQPNPTITSAIAPARQSRERAFSSLFLHGGRTQASL
jgi:hypothetical protein